MNTSTEDNHELSGGHDTSVNTLDVALQNITLSGKGNKYIASNQSVQHLHTDNGQKPCNCNRCGKSCSRPSGHQNHLTCHRGMTSHKCKVCKKYTVHKTGLSCHRCIQKKMKPQKCNPQEKRFPTQHAATPQKKMYSTKRAAHSSGQKRKSPYKCHLCSRCFEQTDKLRGHLLSHSRQKRTKSTTYWKVTQMNQPANTGEEQHGSNTSNINVKQLHGQKRHIHINNTIGEPCMCSVCSKSFARPGNMPCHTSTHPGKVPYNCKDCEKSFVSSGALAQHKRIHTKQKSYKCEFCDKSFKGPNGLSQHKCVHTGKNLHTCSQCGKSFRKLYFLKKHMFSHTREKQHKCWFCDNSFPDVLKLKSHLRIHESCEVCVKSLESKHMCDDHMHTAKKIHKCRICEKLFQKKGHLGEHMRKHTGEKPFKCKVCEKAFISSSDMKRHVRTHTGEKPYKCQICNKAFSQSANRRNHMDIHHS